jgi:hypothetical protein
MNRDMTKMFGTFLAILMLMISVLAPIALGFWLVYVAVDSVLAGYIYGCIATTSAALIYGMWSKKTEEWSAE